MKTKVILFAIFFPVCILAQNNSEDKRNWIIPTFVNFQYAGGVGQYIIGGGYDLNKSKNLRMLIQYGFVPKKRSKKNLHITCLRFNYLPFDFKLYKDFRFKPTIGLGISHIFPDGPGTFIRLPSHYPEGYYAPNAFRLHFNLGGVYEYHFQKEFFIENLEFYIETTTNDLYLKYFYKYEPIKIVHIFSMAFGINIYF